ncbi:hypothetical protein [Flexivirga sp. B27]
MNEDPGQDREAPRDQPPAYPTEEMPTYRRAASHPEPTPPTSEPTASWRAGSTGELPVSGIPAAPVRPVAPRGPYVPTVVRGLLVLLAAALVVVWRVVDDPDWTVVGIGMAIAAGAMLLLTAGVSMLVRHTRDDREFDRMLSRS